MPGSENVGERSLRILFEVSSEMQAAATIEEKLRVMVRGIRDSGWGKVALTLFADFEVRARAFAGLTDDEVARLKATLVSPETRRRLFGPEIEAFRLGECYFIDGRDPAVRALVGDALIDTGPGQRLSGPEAWNPGHTLYVPLRSGMGEVIGMISVDQPADGRVPTADTVLPLELFARSAAAVVEQWKSDQDNHALSRKIKEYARSVKKRNRELADRNLELAEWRRIVQKDHALAKEIQAHLMRPRRQEYDHARFAWRYAPVDRVGGDFFDCREMPDGRIGLICGDVAGHGVSAAMISITCVTLFREACRAGADSSDIASGMNAALVAFVPAGTFASAFVGVLDAGRRALEFTNGGHFPPVVEKGATNVDFADLALCDPALGLSKTTIYRQQRAALEPGTRMVFYTDGIIETSTPAGEQYGAARLASLVASLSDSHLDTLCQTIVNDVAGYRGAGAAADDLTLLALELT
ncbi:MAG: serine/threonine-protein phosphatase [Planctomycetes bacterium]|nr:serine/threonine-protein phosphatase [Planctomycetota bacterium]